MDQTGPQPPPDPGQPVLPPSPWPGYGAPPPSQFPPPVGPPTPPPAKSSNKVIALIAVIGLLGVACAGSVAFGVVKGLSGGSGSASEGRPAAAVGSAGGASSGGPSAATPGRPVGVTGKVPAGSKASSYGVRKDDDLERLCDRWYYPKAPKYTTAVAPHPIKIAVKDRKDLDIRITKSTLGIPYDAPKPIKDAWEPTSPAKVQLVGCVDLVTIGAKVKSCKIDEPKPSSIVMKEGTYRLSLYEVATRRKIFETKLAGENETCSSFIIIGSDRAVYTGLEDSQLTDVLRRYVEQ
jgi:hypothetical protein